MIKIFYFSFIILPILSWAKGPAEECKSISAQSWITCSQALLNESVWSPLKENLLTAKKLSKGSLLLKFDPQLTKSGLAKLEVIDGKIVPMILFGPSDNFNELLITFNHELVHYISSYRRLELVKENAKVKNCLTQYRLELLKDETAAFNAEISFWKNAPASLKDSLKEKFSSRLIEKTVDYSEYYKTLEQKLKAEPKFIEKRYIEMGEYPKCALEII